MGTRLYVGKLPFEMTSGELQELFAGAGNVASVNLITDKFTGRSKGFGFVEMASEAEAKAAIEKFNGHTAGKMQIVVNEARPMEDRPKTGGFGGGRGGGGGNRGGHGGGGRREGGGGGGGYGRW